MKRTTKWLLVLTALTASSACGDSPQAVNSKSALATIAASTMQAKSFTVTVTTSGDVPYEATMHYNAPDRIVVFTQRAGRTIESLSIGTTNYLSDGADPPHYTTAPSPKPFSESILEVLKNLKSARASRVADAKFEISQRTGDTTVPGEVTVQDGMITELRYPTKATVYRFSNFNAAPEVRAPDPSQVRGSTFPTLPGVPPLQKCNPDGSIPAGVDICGK